MLIRTLMLASVSLFGQTAGSSGGWTVPPPGASPGGAVLGGTTTPSGSPSLLVSVDNTDLGAVDSGIPVPGVLTLFNAGGKSFHLLPPAAAASLVKVTYPSDLEIRAGGYTHIPFEFDAHGLEGATSFKVQVATDDPGAPALGVSFSCKVSSSTWAVPLRDSIVGKGQGTSFTTTQATFAFGTGNVDDPFLEVWIQDSSAPLRISVIEKLANGTLTGVVSIDSAKVSPQTSPLGETRVLASTRSGHKNYVTLQWVLAE